MARSDSGGKHKQLALPAAVGRRAAVRIRDL